MEQLTEKEAWVFQLLSTHKTQREIRKETGLKVEQIANYLRRFVRLGMVERVGSPRRYRYRSLNVPFELIQSRERTAPRPAEAKAPSLNEEFIHEMLKSAIIPLTEDQRTRLQENKNTMSRKQLARDLGISKVQLNFELMKIGGRP